MEFLVLISVAIAVISVLICSLVIRRVKVQINGMLDALEDIKAGNGNRRILSATDELTASIAYEVNDIVSSYEKELSLTHNHHFKWWFDLALIRAGYMHAQKGGYRKRCYWSAYKAVLLESSFLDSSACSLIYFFIASSVILPMVET